MHPSPKHLHLATTLALALLIAPFLAAQTPADPIHLGVIYVCNGEHIYVDSCNIRDTSDAATCMVEHPDHVNAGGIAAITSMTRAALKQLLPTCQQPTAQQIARSDAFHKKQQDLYEANVAKANQQMAPQPTASNPAAYGMPTPPKNAEERATRRCVSSGRLPATCTGNSLLGAFGQMLSQVLPGAAKTPPPGPDMAGVFVGAGSWRLDFIDGGVLVNCSFLSPNQETYTLNLTAPRPVLTINTRPRPLVLTLRADGTIVGPGPVTIDGVVPGGYTAGSSTAGHNETSSYTTTERMNANQVQPASSNTTNTYAGGGTYDVTTTHTTNNYVPGTSTPGYTNFVPRRATCPALNLSTKGASVGIQTMQTDLLKSMFSDGEKGPPTPAGIRMHGIYAAPTGFSAEFFPESVILGCGPDSARAYPYTVESTSAGVAVKVNAPDHPLTLAFKPDGTLDPGSATPYQVHGRMVVGQNDNGDFTFVPMEQTCNLATLTPAKAIPSGGGTRATVAAAGTATAKPTGPGGYDNGGGTLSVPGATLGDATLSIVSGFPPQPGVPNPLAGRPYTLLRNSYPSVLSKAGVPVPAGTSPYKYVATVCQTRTPACEQVLTAVKADAASAARADNTGTATLPGVQPGTYYLMISTRYNNQGYVWQQPVQLKSGPNSITLNLQNATPLN